MPLTDERVKELMAKAKMYGGTSLSPSAFIALCEEVLWLRNHPIGQQGLPPDNIWTHQQEGEEAMTDEREELAKLFFALRFPVADFPGAEWTKAASSTQAEMMELADRLLPYIRERVDAAVNAERKRLNMKTCIKEAVKAERERYVKLLSAALPYLMGCKGEYQYMVNGPHKILAEKAIAKLDSLLPEIAAAIRSGETKKG